MSRRYSEEYNKVLLQHMKNISEKGYTVVPISPREHSPQLKVMFMSDMDFKTYELEKQDYHIWFTCEVDGVEYRLAAKKY